MSEVIYELKSPVPYAKGGDGLVDGSFISIQEPTAKHLQYTAPIRQALLRAIAEHKQNQTEVEPSEQADDSGADIDGDILLGLMECSGEDFYKVLLHFQSFVTKSDLFKLEGDQRITQPIMDKMRSEDLYGLFSLVLGSFIAASLL